MYHVVYVFFVKRPQDSEAWPCVYYSQALAECAPHRCTPVVRVEVPV